MAEGGKVLPSNWASIYANHGLISLSTDSGYRMSGLDPQGIEAFLLESCSDEELGQRLMEALARSRVLSPEELGEFFSLENMNKKYEAWVAKLLAALNGMPRRKAFSKMKLCHAVVTSGQLKLIPNRKERGEAWSGRGISETDCVSLPFSSSGAEIGQALRMALSRCK